MPNILSHQGKTGWRCHSSNNDSHNECKEQNIIIKPFCMMNIIIMILFKVQGKLCMNI